jgi:hypothetical protein
MKILKDPKAWVDKLDRAYEALADLVGKTPFDGKKITILSVDELPGAWACAGNPIKWRREFIPKAFEAINKGDWSFGIVHEISHNFDLDYRWVWEAEIMANFKMDYAFPKIKAVIFSGDKVCDYGDRNGLRMTDIYREDELGRITSDRMLQGGWQDDPYHRKLTEIVNEIGWEPFKGVFRWFNTLGPDELPHDALSKRSLFIRALDEQSGVKVSDEFIDWGFAYLAVDVKDAKAAARLLHSRNWTAKVVQRPIQAKPGEKVTVRVDVAGSTETKLAKGLGTHAPSETVYDLDGKYTKFESYVGVPGAVSRDGFGTVTFEIASDGKKVYESPVLHGGGTYKNVAVDIAGVKELKLITTDAGDGQVNDQAAWGDAKVIDADGKVTYLSDLVPVSTRQGYEELHFDTDIDGEPLVYPYGPCSEPVKITGKVDGKTIEFRQGSEPEMYECTLDGFDAGDHLVWLTIRVGDDPVTQHELVTVRVK